MTALPLGMTDAQSYRVIVESIRALAGHQVIGFGEAWTVLTGFDPDDLDDEEARLLRWLLNDLGYERQWVAQLGRRRMQHLWVRGPWPIDFGANLGREITPYVPMG